ncbi:MAG: sigma-70 family RNA polymerase sigma factor [Ignavibacteriales bacterium]|nr:sigma-70 family RNA polymerase sigma factor [Ignavibacteriales bacterium]
MNVKERILIYDALNGEKSAYENLYKEFADLLYVYILHFIKGHREDAKDIWQETFIIAFENLHKFKGNSSFFTWLCGIAKHKASDYLRSKIKGEKYNKDILSQNSEYEVIPENQSDENSTELIVVKTLAQINKEYRMLLISKYIEEKSITEISVTINKTYKATESLLSRARLAFIKTYTSNKNKNG